MERPSFFNEAVCSLRTASLNLSLIPHSSLPASGSNFSGLGCTLIPGLINAHVHAFGNVQNLTDSLHFGVTTVLDMHSEPEYVIKLRRAAAERDDVADYRSCCHGATIRGGWPATMVTLEGKSEEVSSPPTYTKTRLTCF